MSFKSDAFNQGFPFILSSRHTFPWEFSLKVLLVVSFLSILVNIYFNSFILVLLSSELLLISLALFFFYSSFFSNSLLVSLYILFFLSIGAIETSIAITLIFKFSSKNLP